MSDDNPTQTGDLGEMPEAETEQREPNRVARTPCPRRRELPAELGPETNPAVEDVARPAQEGPPRGRGHRHRSHQAGDGTDEDVEPHKDSPPDRWVPLSHQRSRAGHRHPGLDAWLDRARRAAGGIGVAASGSATPVPTRTRRTASRTPRPLLRRTTSRRSRLPAVRRCSPRASPRPPATPAWTRGPRTSRTRTPSRSQTCRSRWAEPAQAARQVAQRRSARSATAASSTDRTQGWSYMTSSQANRSTGSPRTTNSS